MNGQQRLLYLCLSAAVVLLALSYSSLGVEAKPATLPPRDVHAGLSHYQAKRANFIPCIEKYDVATSPYSRIAAFSSATRTGGTSPQIPFITSITNGSETYWNEAQSDNLAFHYHPEAIVYPKDAAQVSHVVTCARKSGNIAVAARSGGHSFAGYGSGGQDGSIVVDLKHFTQVVTNQREEWADVGPGVRLGDVVKELWNHGQKGMPHGTCPTVGVGGHTLCGGFGPTSRHWGLATDAIIEADVVLSDGSIVTATPESHPEILWALKGAGHFFGIVTRFRFRTHDASSPMTFIEYKWTRSNTGPEFLNRAIQSVQNWVSDPDFPSKLGFHVQFAPATILDYAAGLDRKKPQMTLHLRGMYLGSTREFQVWGDKLRDRLKEQDIAPPDVWTEKEVNFLQLNELWDDFGRPGAKLDTFAERLIHNKFLAKTVQTEDHTKKLTPEAFAAPAEAMWDAMNRHFGARRKYSWNVYMEMSGGSNAKYRDDPELVRSSSLPHRDTLWLVQASVGTAPAGVIDDSGHQLLKELNDVFTKAIEQSGTRVVGYGCYTDSDLTRDGSWKKLYYDQNLDRLTQLKHKLDPSNLFRNPQSLGAASTDREAGSLQKDYELNHLHDWAVSHPLPRRSLQFE